MLAAGEWSCILKIRHDVQHTLVPSPYEFLLFFESFCGMVGCMGIRSHNFTISPWFFPCFPQPLHLRWHRWWKNWIWRLSRNAAEDHPTWISNISWKKSHVPDLHLKMSSVNLQIVIFIMGQKFYPLVQDFSQQQFRIIEWLSSSSSATTGFSITGSGNLIWPRSIQFMSPKIRSPQN